MPAKSNDLDSQNQTKSSKDREIIYPLSQMVNSPENDRIKRNKGFSTEKRTFTGKFDLRLIGVQQPCQGGSSLILSPSQEETSCTNNVGNQCSHNSSLQMLSAHIEKENFNQLPLASSYYPSPTQIPMHRKLDQSQKNLASGPELFADVAKGNDDTEINSDPKNCNKDYGKEKRTPLHKFDFITTLQPKCVTQDMKSSTSTSSPDNARVSVQRDFVNISVNKTFSHEQYPSIQTPQKSSEYQQNRDCLYQRFEERCKEIFCAADQYCLSLVLESHVPYVEDTLGELAEDETEDDALYKLAVKKKFVEVVEKLQEDELPTQRRGNLPKESIAYLKKWFDEHSAHPCKFYHELKSF